MKMQNLNAVRSRQQGHVCNNNNNECKIWRHECGLAKGQRAEGRSALHNLDTLRPVRVTTFTAADGEPEPSESKSL
jgi:hypothetical protein